ncbi:MAG: DNA-processing protein DprA [Propionibacteriaceae bacterium]
MSERLLRMCLAATAEPAGSKVREVVAKYGVEKAWERVCSGLEDPAWQSRAESLDLAALCAAMNKVSARFVIPSDCEWPKELDDLDFIEDVQGLGGTPLGLWVRGERSLSASGVALVGARASTSYGEHTVTQLSGDLANCGVEIISGGAYGIDAAAHRGALAVSGKTAAILACGIDELYPSGHAALLSRMAQEQLVVSEYAPGQRPTRARFLARNRLIAALSQGTVVVEAAARSGARNTANWATRLGRVVMAVPGPVHSSLSYLPHQLIRDQEAVLVDDAPSVLAMISPIGQGTLFDSQGEKREFDDLTPEEKIVLESFPVKGSYSVAEVAVKIGLAMRELSVALRSLERRGVLVESDSGQWNLVRCDTSRPIAENRKRYFR